MRQYVNRIATTQRKVYGLKGAFDVQSSTVILILIFPLGGKCYSSVSAWSVLLEACWRNAMLSREFFGTPPNYLCRITAISSSPLPCLFPFPFCTSLQNGCESSLNLIVFSQCISAMIAEFRAGSAQSLAAIHRKRHRSTQGCKIIDQTRFSCIFQHFSPIGYCSVEYRVLQKSCMHICPCPDTCQLS